MSFTDEVLTRLKLLVGRTEERAFVSLQKQTFENLLARLEAAEEVAKAVEITHPEDENCGCSMCDLLKAWLIAKGEIDGKEVTK